jgi:hypothetical protein
MLVRMWENGTLTYCWWECKLVQPLWKTIWKLFTKLEIDLPYDPAIHLFWIYQKECESCYNQDTCTPNCITALVTIVKLWKQQDAPLLMNGLRKCGIYTKWNFT